MSTPTTVERFRAAQDAFVDAAVDLGRAWDALADGNEPALDTVTGYPFDHSFDLMIHRIIEWKHATIASVHQVRVPTYPVVIDGKVVRVTVPPNEPRACEHQHTFLSTVCPAGTVCADCGRVLVAMCAHDQGGDRVVDVERVWITIPDVGVVWAAKLPAFGCYVALDLDLNLYATPALTNGAPSDEWYDVTDPDACNDGVPFLTAVNEVFGTDFVVDDEGGLGRAGK